MPYPHKETEAAMSDHFDGTEIARERIEREAREQTGQLDLGQLGLTKLPVELLELTHLWVLNLGRTHYLDPNPPNDLDTGQLYLLAKLPNLTGLSLSHTGLS